MASFTQVPSGGGGGGGGQSPLLSLIMQQVLSEGQAKRASARREKVQIRQEDRGDEQTILREGRAAALAEGVATTVHERQVEDRQSAIQRGNTQKRWEKNTGELRRLANGVPPKQKEAFTVQAYKEWVGRVGKDNATMLLGSNPFDTFKSTVLRPATSQEINAWDLQDQLASVPPEERQKRLKAQFKKVDLATAKDIKEMTNLDGAQSALRELAMKGSGGVPYKKMGLQDKINAIQTIGVKYAQKGLITKTISLQEAIQATTDTRLKLMGTTRNGYQKEQVANELKITPLVDKLRSLSGTAAARNSAAGTLFTLINRNRVLDKTIAGINAVIQPGIAPVPPAVPAAAYNLFFDPTKGPPSSTNVQFQNDSQTKMPEGWLPVGDFLLKGSTLRVPRAVLKSLPQNISPMDQDEQRASQSNYKSGMSPNQQPFDAARGLALGYNTGPPSIRQQPRDPSGIPMALTTPSAVAPASLPNGQPFDASRGLGMQPAGTVNPVNRQGIRTDRDRVVTRDRTLGGQLSEDFINTPTRVAPAPVVPPVNTEQRAEEQNRQAIAKTQPLADALVTRLMALGKKQYGTPNDDGKLLRTAQLTLQDLLNAMTAYDAQPEPTQGDIEASQALKQYYMINRAALSRGEPEMDTMQNMRDWAIEGSR
jgi:hypothetical protein